MAGRRPDLGLHRVVSGKADLTGFQDAGPCYRQCGAASICLVYWHFTYYFTISMSSSRAIVCVCVWGKSSLIQPVVHLALRCEYRASRAMNLITEGQPAIVPAPWLSPYFSPLSRPGALNSLAWCSEQKAGRVLGHRVPGPNSISYLSTSSSTVLPITRSRLASKLFFKH